MAGQWVGLDDPRPVVVSWGAGVQSTAIALLVERGELPRPAAWLFADTGGEPEAVYAHVERWRPRLDALGGFHVVKNKKETLPEHIKRGGGSLIPFYVEGEDGKRGTMPTRGCTRDFKIIPMQKWVKANMPGAVSWLGISMDEVQRCKPDGSICYPLIELRLSRSRLLRMLADAGESAPKSACSFCPYRSDSAWKSLSDADVEAAARVEDDLVIYGKTRKSPLRSEPSLHRTGISVRKRPWETVGGEQLDLALGDCGGVCFT